MLLDWGYLGLFVAAFLAATILPLSSEAVLGGLLLAGLSPVWLVALATLGNVLGAVVNYALGYWANTHALHKWLGVSVEARLRAEQRFQRYGLYALLLAWVPLIGDPITVVAGLLRVHFVWFLGVVFIGKFLRYLLLVLVLS